MRPKTGFLMTAAGLAGFAAAWLLRPALAGEQTERLESKVVSPSEAKVHSGPWGEFRRYFKGETRSTVRNLAGVAVLKPGEALHRAHRHPSEEYLILTEGQGVWQLGDRRFEATAGDVLYAEPWTYHGLTNTGDEPLRFAVVRFRGKKVPPPPHPDDGRPDELK